MKRYYSTLVALALFGICSGSSLAQNPPPAQIFYVPLPEPQMLTVLGELAPSLTNTAYFPVNPMTRYIGISVIGKGTIIYYDQMENGYEADITNPTSIYDAVTNPSGTQIWGDGDPSNGAPPGIPSDLLEGGTTIILNGEMNTPGEPTAASPKFNGGDKIASSKAIAITTSVWADQSATLESDAVEVYDTFSWGTNYRTPVGTNISIPGQSFQYVKAVIQAGPGGAAVEVRSTNNTLLASTNLTEGQSFFPTNNLSIGTRINADKPVQVDLITGDVAANSGEAYESRWYPLMPTNLWASSYYTPVSTPSTSRGRGDSSDETGTATTVYLYNPGASAINVSYVTRGTSGASSDVSKFVTATNNFTANSRAWANSPVGDVYAPLVSITATNNGFTNFGAPQGPWIGIIPKIPTNNLSNRVAAAQNGGATGIIIVNNNNSTNNMTNNLGTLTIPVVGVTTNQDTAIRSTPLGDGWVSVTATNAVVAKYVTTTNNFTSGVWNNSAPGNVYGPLVSITNTNTTIPSVPEGPWIGIIPRSPTGNLSNRVVAARNAGAAAIVIVNTNNTTNNLNTALGALTIPVVGVPSGQNSTIRSTPLGTGWVRVSGNQTTNTISVPAGGFNSQVVANGYGARFYSTNSQTFYAVSATDSTGTTNSFNRTWDWGFTLVPQTQLTAQALVGLGFGRDPTSGTRPNENGSPVWVSTVGNGNSNTTVYIDYDADPDTGRFIDPQGFRYDTTITLKELESVKVYNPSGNQSGMLLYSLDPNVRLVAAWGQDPLQATAGAPGFDGGTGVPPMPQFTARKKSALFVDVDGDGYMSPGDYIKYELTINNVSRLPVDDVLVKDTLPDSVNYLADTTVFTPHTGSPQSVADNPSGNIFPLSGAGRTLGPPSSLPGLQTWKVEYQVEIKAFEDLPNGTTSVINSATVNSEVIDDPVHLEEQQPLFGKIGDFVWVDTNGNGIQDGGEPGLNGVTVNLLNSDGTPVLDGNGNPRTTTTATHNGNPGYYQFVGVPEGNYIIEFVTPAGYVFTTQNADSQGVNGGANSDPSPTTGRTPSFSLAAGQNNNAVDAGMYEPGSISGSVLRDLSGDNNGDEPMEGVTVTLKDSNGNDIDSDPNTPGVQPTTTTTDEDGNYSFENLPPGNYQVVQTVPGGFTAVNDADGGDFTVIGNITPITINSGTNVTDQDFVNQTPAAITGTVFDDLNNDGLFDGGDGKISGVTIYLYTDPNGDGDPSDGVLVDTTTTAVDGTYSFAGMPLGNYVVVERDPFGYISVNDVQGAPTDNRVAVAVTQLITYTDKDFLDQAVDPELLGTISGQVRLDEDQDGNLADSDPGIPGVTVQLWTDPNGDGDPSDGEMVLTTTTDGDGYYTFTDVPPGKYVVVEIDPDGHVSTADKTNPNDNRIPVDLPNSGNSTKNDFLDAESGGALATIGDTIWQDTNNNGIKDGGEPGIDGVVVWIYRDGQTPGVDAPYGVTTTSGGGQYQFANLPPGDYTIMIPPVNFEPGNALADAQTASSVVNTNDDNINNDSNGIQTGGPGTAVLSPQFNLGNGEVDNTKDFGFVPTSSLGTISGSVMVDTDANGTPNEPLEGVTLTLVDASGNPILVDGNPITTTSAADGSYSFTDVPPGTYGVKMTDVPETYIGVSDIDGGLVDWIGDVTDITLPPGESSPGNDFLLRKRACPPTWEAWQDKWTDLGLEDVTPGGNDDEDINSNLIEFAFCMNPSTGKGSPYCMAPSVEAVDKVDLVYTTTAGGTTGVTYELQYAATLGENSTTWTTVSIPEENKIVTPQVINGEDTGKDVVRVTDLESITGLQSGTGFVRMKITVNTVEDGPVSTTTGNDVGGWIQTPLDYRIRSFNDPFLQCPLFTGTISGVDGQDIISAVSGGGVDYNDLVSAQPSYAEITSGAYEGHRFDIVGGGVNRFTAAIDNDIYSGDAPHSTLSAPPEGLVGAKFVVRPHRTIGNVFPTRAYVPTDDPETASIVQMFAGDHWETLWLYDDGGGENAVPAWVSVTDVELNDRGGDVLNPGQGGFIYSRHPEQGGASFMLYGKVRPNDFIRPLKGTLDNVGGGYPLPQSPDGRAMTPADSGFFPNRSFSTADQFLIWRGDTWQANDANYDTYFLIGGTIARPVAPDWLLTGDTSATKQNAVKHFAPDYSILLKRKYSNPTYKMPLPWKADAE